MVISYSNSPNYINIKNDYHIWGKNQDGFAIHYHLVFKSKPSEKNTYKVVYLKDNTDNYTGELRLAKENEAGDDYIPADWRAELYLQGLSKQARQERPDVYEQELLDLFDTIYNFKVSVYLDNLTDYTGEEQIGNIPFTVKDNLITTKDILTKAENELEFQQNLYETLKSEYEKFQNNINKYEDIVNDIVAHVGLGLQPLD